MTHLFFKRIDVLKSIFARIVQMIGGFGIILLLANTMTPYAIGMYYIQSAIGIAISFIAFSPLFYGIQRLYPDDADLRSDFVKSMFVVTLVPSAIGIILNVVLFLADVNDYILNIIAIIYFALGEALFSQTTNFNSTNPERSKYLQAVLIRTVSLFIFIISLHKSNYANHVWATLAAFSFSSILATVLSSSEWRGRYMTGRVNPSYLSEAFAFGWPYMVTQILRQPLERGDRLFAAMLIGPIAAGQLAMASDLARRTIQGLAINARLAFGRLVIRQFDEGDEQSAARTLVKMMMMTMILSYPIAFGVSAFGEAIIAPVLSGKLSGGSVDVLKIVPIAFCFEAIRVYVYEVIFEFSHKTKYLMNIAAAGLGVQAVTFCLLGMLMGLHGVAIALVITHAATLVITVYFSKKVFDISLNMRLVFALAVATVVASQAVWIAGRDYLGFNMPSMVVSLACSIAYVGILFKIIQCNKPYNSSHLKKKN